MRDHGFGLARRRELLVAFATKDFKVRYHSLKLAIGYTFGVSLLTMAVLTAALGRVFRDAVPGSYPLYVLAALIPWNFLSFSLHQSSDSFRASAPIVRKVPFPRELVPLGVVTANSLNMLVAFCAFVPIGLLLGIRPAWTWLALPLAILVLATFVAGLAMLLSTAGAFYEETRPLVEVLTMLWFYATPIFYPGSVVPPHFRWVTRWNPMAALVEIFRDLLLYGRWPALAGAVYVVGVALVVALVGWNALRRFAGVIPDRIG